MKKNEQLRLFKASSLEEIWGEIAQNALMRTQRPIKSCLELVAAHGCEAVILQDPVQDPDFFGEYQAYYSKLFVPVHRYCQRLHFFRLQPAEGEDALHFVDRAAASTTSYIGFITLRPIHWAPVGATFLPAPPPPAHDVVSTDKFPVHIGGCKFEIKATPFMQQDSSVGVCAQAAIWMALRTLRARMGNSAFDPAQITTAATRLLATGGDPGRDGLMFPQMIEAVRSAGHRPLAVEFDYHGKDDEHDAELELLRMRRTVYPYVESEIPTILVLQSPSDRDAHAVVAVGHQWRAVPAATDFVRVILPWQQGEATVSVLHAASWIPGFLAHNDNTGPYQIFSSRGDDLDMKYAMEDLRYVLVPLPPDVLISAEEAEAKAVYFLHRMLRGVFQAIKNPAFDPSRISDQLVLRPYLMQRRDFRKWAREEKQLAETLKRHYRLLPLPRHVWVLELNLASGYSEAPLGKGCRVGEVLIDPSADIDGNVVLAIHLNLTAMFESRDKKPQEGIFYYRSDWAKEPDSTDRVDRDQTYRPYVHHAGG